MPDELLPDPPDDKGQKPDADPVAASLAEMRQEIKALQQERTARAAPPQPQNNIPTAEDLRKEFFKDPVRMAAAISGETSNQAVAQIQATIMPGLIKQARESTRNTDPEIFDKYEPEIIDKVTKTHPSNHGNPDVWKTAFDLVKGTHFDEISAMKAKKTGTSNGTDGPAAPSTKSPAPPKVAPLKDEEVEFSKNFKITQDGFRRGKEIINGQSERGPSSWDSVITFDSGEKRKRAAEARARTGKG